MVLSSVILHSYIEITHKDSLFEHSGLRFHIMLSKYCLTPIHFSLSNYQLLVGGNCESSVDGQGSLLLTASLFSLN